VTDLVSSEDVDAVAVTVKVPHHANIVGAAIAAGKNVYCEWPLGNGVDEARTLAKLAREKGVLAVAGLQSRFAPELMYLRELLDEGYVGEVLSSSIVASGMWFGPTVDQRSAYTLDDKYGATMLTIGVGHLLSAVEAALGPIVELSATLATRRSTALNTNTREVVARLSADQVMVNGRLANGAVISLHYRGGSSRGPGLSWDINGTQGDLRVSGAGGHPQMVPLELSGGSGEEASLLPIILPLRLSGDTSDGPMVGNVRRVWAAIAEDLRTGSHKAPTFDDAVRTHELLATIIEAANSGQRIKRNRLDVSISVIYGSVTEVGV
jgi:predicted dehydrogenase